MTADEFYRAYAGRAQTDVEVLAGSGYRAYPCHCGEVGCEGWAMMPSSLIDMARKDGVPFALGVLTSDTGYAP